MVCKILGVTRKVSIEVLLRNAHLEEPLPQRPKILGIRPILGGFFWNLSLYDLFLLKGGHRKCGGKASAWYGRETPEKHQERAK